MSLSICATCGAELDSVGGVERCPVCHPPEPSHPHGPDFIRRETRILEAGASASSPPVPDPAADSELPRELGEYQILGEVSRGGMGVIYRARQKSLGRIVAMKVLIAGRDASQDQIKRFLREARAAAHLRHPNIVPIHDVGSHQGKYYFTMELVDGKSLHDLLRQGRLPVERSVKILQQVADAIDYAHREGIIHRDIKPGNVLLDGEGRALLTDFGLARTAQPDTVYTRSGMTMGTPNYMPPEQARGEVHQIDERSDVYSLGAVFYEMLTGVPPFVAESEVETILKVIHEEPIPPRKRNPKLPQDLDTICMKAIEKQKDHRYGSAREFLDDLRAYGAGEPIRARPAGLAYRAWKKVRKHRGVAITFTVGVAVASAWIGYDAWKTRHDAALQAARDKETDRLAKEREERRNRLNQEGEQVFRAERWERVIEVYREFIKDFPDDYFGVPVAMYRIGLAAQALAARDPAAEQKWLAVGTESLQALIARYPPGDLYAAYARLSLARLALKIGDYAEMEKQLGAVDWEPILSAGAGKLDVLGREVVGSFPAKVQSAAVDYFEKRGDPANAETLAAAARQWEFVLGMKEKEWRRLLYEKKDAGAAEAHAERLLHPPETDEVLQRLAAELEYAPAFAVYWKARALYEQSGQDEPIRALLEDWERRPEHAPQSLPVDPREAWKRDNKEPDPARQQEEHLAWEKSLSDFEQEHRKEIDAYRKRLVNDRSSSGIGLKILLLHSRVLCNLGQFDLADRILRERIPALQVRYQASAMRAQAEANIEKEGKESHEAARQLLTYSLKQFPNLREECAQALLLLGNSYLAERNPEAALPNFLSLAKEYADLPALRAKALNLAGLACSRIKGLERQAIDSFTQVVSDYGAGAADPETQLELLAAQLMTGRIDSNAYRDKSAPLTTKDTQNDVQFWPGMRALIDGDRDLARAQFQSTLSVKPGNEWPNPLARQLLQDLEAPPR